MLMNLQRPVLGKRKSIDPCQHDQFSAKGEAILVTKDEALGEKKDDATLDEKEKEGDPCVCAGEEVKACDNNEAFRRVMDRVGEEVKGWDSNEAFWRVMDEVGKYNEEIRKAEDAGLIARPPPKSLGPCKVCMGPVRHNSCPWTRGTSFSTVPEVRPCYRVLCKRCGNTEFEIYGSNKCLTCNKCGCFTLCVVRKICPFCLRKNHVDNKDEECRFYGKEWNEENDPFLSRFFEA